MKPRYTILFSVFSLLLLFVVQFFLINGLYQLRRHEFDTLYSQKIHEALSIMQEQYNTNGMDSVFLVLDQYALDMMETYETAFEDSVKQRLAVETLENVQIILEQYERVGPFLRWYLEQQNMESDFIRGFLIHQLVIIGPEHNYVIIDDTNISYPEDSDNSIEEQALQINTFHLEGTFFRIWFDYYIDFTHRTHVLMSEMVLAFTLALLSVFISGIVFMITIRNMLKQRRLSEMKTDFINNMAHELRTPLTTISVAGGSLENPQLDREKIGELTTIIRNQNKQLSKMIEHILDINLWEKDQIQLHKKRVDIESLLKNRIDAFAVEHKDDQMNMTSDIHCSPAEVYIDEFQIGIAIHNVLSNAVKYGGDPVAIDVKASVHDHRLIISIRDNGQGIPERQQKKIFEKFYRLPQNKTGKGLGLGLFYVKKIIDLHGGDVLVKSKLNEGTTFTLSIPVK